MFALPVLSFVHPLDIVAIFKFFLVFRIMSLVWDAQVRESVQVHVIGVQGSTSFGHVEDELTLGVDIDHHALVLGQLA